MTEPRRIRVVGQRRAEPDLKALARAVIELAKLLHTETDEPAPTKQKDDADE
jgi:hypothetical protein